MGANINGIAQSSGELTLSVHGATKSINLFDSATGEMKNTYQVFEDINQYWKEMDDNEKQALATTIAGKNHMEVFTAIMGNFGSVLNATQSAILSEGSAMKENEAVLDSFEGHLNRLQAAFENFSTNLIDSDTIKGGIDVITAGINFLNTDVGRLVTQAGLLIGVWTTVSGVFSLVAQSMGVAKAEAAGMMASFVGKGAKQLMDFPNIISKTVTKFKTLGTAIKTFGLGKTLSVLGEQAENALSKFKGLTYLALGVVAFKSFQAALNQQKKELEQLGDEYDQTTERLKNLKSEYETLSTKGDLTAGEQARLAVLEAEIDAEERLLALQAERLYDRKYGEESAITGGQHGKYEGAVGSDKTGLDKVKENISSVGDLTTKYQENQQAIIDLDKSSSTYTEDVKKLTSEQEKLETQMSNQRSELAKQVAEILELGEAQGGLTDEQQAVIDAYMAMDNQIKEVLGAMGEGAEANGIFASSFAEVEEEANLATEALQAYATASELPEYDANFKSYSDAWNTLNGEIEAGRTHSRAFQAAAELLFGQDWLERVNYSTDAIKTQTEALRQFFESGESGGANLINTLDSMTNSEGQIVTATGEVIGQFKQLEDGASVLELPNENLAKLAETLGMDEGALVSMLQAWNMFGEGFSMFDTANLVEDLGNAGKAFGDFADGSGKAVVNLDEAKTALEASGKSAWEVHDILQQISDDPAVITVEGEQSVDDAYNMVHKLGLEIESVDGESINISTESLSNLIQVMGLSESQAEELVGKLSQIDGVTFVDAAGNAQTMSQALQTVSSAAEGASDASTGFKGAVENAVNAAKIAAQARPFDQAKASADSATSSVRTLGREFNALPTQKIMTIIVNKIKNYDEEATGTNSAPGGLTLVGEEYAPDGKPRPELVVANGKARLVGTNGPEFVNLPKGAQVYPYKKTKEMLRNGHLPEEVDAYAGGTVDAVRQQATGGVSSSSSSKKPTTSSGSGSKSKTPSTPSKSKASDNKALKEQNDLFKEQIDIMEHNLFLMQKRGASIQEQTEYMALMQQELNNQANYFRSKGVAENDEFIRTLQKQWKQSTTFIQ